MTTDRAAFTSEQLAEIAVELERYKNATPPLPWPPSTVVGLLATIDALRAERDAAAEDRDGLSTAVKLAELNVEAARPERDAARVELRELARVGDTLSPQEIINHCANGLGVDRHDYPGDPEIQHRSVIELNSALKTTRAERDAAMEERDELNMRVPAIEREAQAMADAERLRAEVAALTADNERLRAALSPISMCGLFCDSCQQRASAVLAARETP